MAKAKAKSKTDLIRAELPKHEGSPTKTALALQKRGHKISKAYVTTVKANDKRKAKQPSRAPGRPRNDEKYTVDPSDLIAAAIKGKIAGMPDDIRPFVRLIADLGIDKAKKKLELLAKKMQVAAKQLGDN